MTKDQKQIEAQKAVIDALQETIAAQERTILAKARTVKALQDLLVQQNRETLKWFASEMETTLRKNDYKDGWSDCTLDWLFGRLLEEVEELREMVVARKGAHIIAEATDVANYCMMLADRVRE